MLSVIIPTMWKYQPFIEFLSKLVHVNCIQEIIIINNDKSKTPTAEILNHPKIRMHNSDTNLFVNPSWNLGAKLANFDKLAFLSDDTTIDLRVFEKADNFLTDETGVIGILTRYNEFSHIYDKFYTDGNINFVSSREPEEDKRPPAIGIGNLFFISKKDWKDIPEEIKIFHGEVLVWNRMETYKDNYIITNCFVETPWHATWKPLSEEIQDEFYRIQMRDQEICESMSFNF